MEKAQSIMELLLIGAMLIYVLILIIVLFTLIYKILKDK